MKQTWMLHPRRCIRAGVRCALCPMGSTVWCLSPPVKLNPQRRKRHHMCPSHS
ncbi:unnamed protein product [Periconia digitata]|uniref:Uncharacterized protein n=1 Tax=Periconia digitata TaxID=1303443 RepID=A0A9W4U2N7_9PLEO|nr:unnamed protein product [Periconia digitata]